MISKLQSLLRAFAIVFVASVLLSVHHVPDIFKNMLPGRHETFNLSTMVTDKSVGGLLFLLNDARPNDDITIFINSPGGSVEAGIKVLKAMQDSKVGHIEAVVTGMAASMAEGIALEADHITMKPYSKLMFHYGDANGIVLSEKDMHNKDIAIADYMVLIDGCLHTQADPLITPAGWVVIHKGGELWVTADQFQQRGGDTYEGRKISNPYIEQIDALLNNFGSDKLVVTW